MKEKLASLTCINSTKWVFSLALLLLITPAFSQGLGDLRLEPLGTYETGVFDEGAAEIPAFDPLTNRLFISNANDGTVDVLDITDPENPTKLFAININGVVPGGTINSVAVGDTLVALAIDLGTDPGRVAFFKNDMAEGDPALQIVTVGALPDMVTFTPDLSKALTANEGEPANDGSVDPEGSVSIIDLTDFSVTTASFNAFDDRLEELRSEGVRIFTNDTVSRDLEPEYIAVSPDGLSAFVTLQENNAVAVVDLVGDSILDVVALGYKDHMMSGNGLDASDRDNVINIRNWPVLGMYMPDAIASFEALDGNTYYITANEGDARDYDFFAEEERIADLTLDPERFPNAANLQEDYALGRLNATIANGDNDGDGDYDSLFVYGTRSFSIWDASGNLVFDSGDEIEKIVAEEFPDDFNSNNDENDSFESRSDNKGPEPEGVAIGTYRGKTYAFIGLERQSAIMVYDVTRAGHPVYLGLVSNRDYAGDAEAGTAGDLGPEGLIFIGEDDSPTGQPLLVVTNEVSGTTTIWGVTTVAEQIFTGAPAITTEFSGRFTTGLGAGSAEITAYDANTGTLYVLNSSALTVNVVDIADPANPQVLDTISFVGSGSGIQSVAVSVDSVLAVAVAADNPTDPGKIIFGKASVGIIDSVTVGALPDMITFNADGSKLFVANEGEPNDDYSIDPEGSVSIVDMTDFSVTTVGFTAFNADSTALREAGVRIFGPGATPAQDFEPEYIALSPDESVAYVALQENNAVAILDMASKTFTAVLPLGRKNYNLPGNAIDASDRDEGINIRNWPAFGMYQPDGIATYEVGGKPYIVSANEGDARDYDTFSEEARVDDLILDPIAFPNADKLQMEENLGRLEISLVDGDIDGDGDYDFIQGYGARSFSVWDGETGALVWDSGDQFEQLSSVIAPDIFNSNRGGDSPDSRSDAKASEPEGVAIGEIGGRNYAFIGLERQGGIFIYDITVPNNPVPVAYERSTVPTDDSPEGLVFIPAADSPTGDNLLVVSYEESGTVAIFTIDPLNTGVTPETPTNLMASVEGSRLVNLTWDEDPAAEENGIGYRIERAKNGGDFMEIATVPGKGAEYEDMDVMAGDTLIYRIKAFSGITESVYSNLDTVQIGYFLHIVHNNDGESQLLNAGSGELEFYGGVARFKTIVDELREYADMTGNSIAVLSSGDNFLAGPEFDASLSLPETEKIYDAVVVDAIGYDALAIGNHDFDFGPDLLARYIGDVENGAAYLSANLDFTAETVLQDLVDAGRIAPRTIIEKNGERIGVVGLTTPNLPFISSPRGVTVNPDLTTIAQAQIDALEAEGVNKIILISHLQGLSEELALVESLTGVDIVIAGGGDDLLANPDDVLLPGDEAEGPYPTIGQDAGGNDVYFVTTAGEYRYVGHLLVEFDGMGNVLQISDLSGPIAVTPDFEEDQTLVEEVQVPVAAHIEALAQNIIATSEVGLDGVRNNIRSVETNLGNMVADAMLWQANQIAGTAGFESVPQATVGIQNGGGIRNNTVIPPGNFTELNTFDILPFSNLLAVVPNIPAEQFKELVENMVSRAEDMANSGTGRFGQVAGFDIVWNPEGTAIEFDSEGNVTAQGNRVVSITLADGTAIVEGGEVVSGAPSVNIAIADFSARGGDEYPFRDAPFTVLGVTYQQALFNYITAPTADGGLEGTIAAADYPEGGEGRITTGKLDQAITFAQADLQIGVDTEVILSGTASSGLPVSYTLVAGNVSLSGDTLTINGPGTVTIRAEQAGDAFYNAAEAVEVSFCINPEEPTISSTGDDAESAEFTLTAPAGADSYQWFVDGNEIAGATSQTLSVTQAGSYTVQITINGCSATTASANAVALTAEGLQDLAGSLQVYPNPANANLKVLLSNYRGKTAPMATIYSATGQLLFEGTLKLSGKEASLEVNLNGYDQGLYILRLSADGLNVTQKIIKQ